MTNRFMVSAAALALLAGSGFANAQGVGKEPGGAAGGSTMQHSSPADTSAGHAKSESTGPSRSEASEPKGGMKSTQSEQKSPGAMKKESAQDSAKEKSGTKSTESEQKSPGAMKKESAQDSAKEKSGTKSTESEQKSPGAMKKESAQDSAKEKSGTNAAETKSTTQQSQTTGQAAAGAKLTTEQRTKITTVFRSERVAPENNVNFSISIGTRVPREGVRLHPLPSEVVTIYPEWRGYEFIRVRDQILVIDPNTYEIVAVLEA